jgi:CHAD domain-containing protein
MRKFAKEQTSTLLRRVSKQVDLAAKSSDQDTVHDLRVAIRRLSRCLRVFAPFYPDNSWKDVRKCLKTVMAAAGAVRDLDIAMELVAEAGKNAKLTYRLAEAHREGQQRLEQAARSLKKSGELRKWKTSLGLNR